MFNKDIGIDLGTANVLIYIKGQGIVLNEPSVVAIDSDTKRPLAVGSEARDMLGRTPGKVKAIKPMKDGVIADFETTGIMLNYFIKKVNGKGFFQRPRILICCPSNITQVEKNAIKEAAERTGARRVFLEEEPKVAAIGAGMDISKPSGNMVIDIGGGTTDIAILSLGGIVESSSIRIAGSAFDPQSKESRRPVSDIDGASATGFSITHGIPGQDKAHSLKLRKIAGLGIGWRVWWL